MPRKNKTTHKQLYFWDFVPPTQKKGNKPATYKFVLDLWILISTINFSGNAVLDISHENGDVTLTGK